MIVGWGFELSGVNGVLAAVAVKSRVAVARSGSRYVRGWWLVDHLTSGIVDGVVGGQGAAFIVN